MTRVSISSPNFVCDGVAAVMSVGGLTTAGTINLAVRYFKSPQQMSSAPSHYHGCVNSSNVHCVSPELSVPWYPDLDIRPITQLGLSSSLSMPRPVSSSSSSSSFPSTSSSELARLFRLAPIAWNISWDIFSGVLVVDLSFSAFPTSSCSFIIAVSASWTRRLTTGVSLSTSSLIYFSVSFLLKTCIAWLFSSESIMLDHQLHDAPKARISCTSKPLLLWFTSWCCGVNRFVNFLYMPAGSGKRCLLAALTVVSWVDFVVGQDVGCCKIWTTWRQAASWIWRLVHLINLNTAKSTVWPSLHWELQC